MPGENLGHLFRETVRNFPDKKALSFKEQGVYVSLTWSEVGARVDAIALGLLRRGLSQGDRALILSENRPEWAFFDLACQLIGVVTVPLYASLTPSEIKFIAEDSGAKVAAVSSRSQFEKMAAILPLPKLSSLVVFDTSLTLSKQDLPVPLVSIKELEKTPMDAAALSARLAAVKAQDVASLIYTSGTTGFPKGVMLTHRNFIANVLMCEKTLRMGHTDIHLSFLPLSHVFERTAGYYLMIHIGATIAYAESLDTVPQNLLEVSPTFILGVPRFFEKTRDRVLEAVKKAGAVKKALFFWAKDLGEARRKLADAGRRPGPALRLKIALAERLVYAKFRARLGGRIRFCVAGGAPLGRELAEFFCDLGVMIYEGYGLTETAPVISVNLEGRCRFGSVGIPLEGVRVRIAEDGEILTKSDCVMKGYYGRPEDTAAAVTDGWFHTGDLGRIDKDSFLFITGRKKELIVTSGGKKVSPRPVEEAIERDEYVLRCVLFGEGRKFLTALIVPDRAKIEEYALQHKIAHASYEELLKNPDIYRFLERRVEDLTRDLASFERIKYFALLENDFSQASGELTPTLKVKRDTVLTRYRDRLLPFYEETR